MWYVTISMLSVACFYHYAEYRYVEYGMFILLY